MLKSKPVPPFGFWSFLGGAGVLIAAYQGLYVSKPAAPLVIVVFVTIMLGVCAPAMDFLSHNIRPNGKRTCLACLSGSAGLLFGWFIMLLQ